jgi:AcrR family transcriptional regulator
MAQETALERIVHAGKRLFARQGFHATGMRDIARLARVSIGSLYHYFHSKEELFLAVVRREFEVRLRQARDLLAQGLPPQEVLRQVMALHFSGGQGDAESAQLLSRAWLPEDPNLWRRLRVLLDEYARAIAQVLAEAAAAGKIRPVHPLLAAYALLGMAGVVTMRAHVQDELAKEFRLLGAAELAEIAWRAFRPEEEGKR